MNSSEIKPIEYFLDPDRIRKRTRELRLRLTAQGAIPELSRSIDESFSETDRSEEKQEARRLLRRRKTLKRGNERRKLKLESQGK